MASFFVLQDSSPDTFQVQWRWLLRVKQLIISSRNSAFLFLQTSRTAALPTSEGTAVVHIKSYQLQVIDSQSYDYTYDLNNRNEMVT